MKIMDWVTIISTVIAVISICLNIIQWRAKKEQQKALRSQSQASFNVFHEIQYLTNLIFKDTKNIQSILGSVNQIKGLTVAELQEIVAYSREHLDFLPFEDLQEGKIFLGKLPKPGTQK